MCSCNDASLIPMRSRLFWHMHAAPLLWVFLRACTVLSYSACFWTVDMWWSSNVQLILTLVFVNKHTLHPIQDELVCIVYRDFVSSRRYFCKKVNGQTYRFLWLGLESQLLFDVSNGVLNTEQDIPRGYSSATEPTNIITDGKLCDPDVQQYRWHNLLHKVGALFPFFTVDTFTFLDFLGRNPTSSGSWSPDPVPQLIL